MMQAVSAPKGAVAPTVSAIAASDTNSRGVGGDCNVGLVFNSDGQEYDITNAGAQGVDLGTWLDTGIPGDVWVEFLRSSGTAANWIGIANSTRVNMAGTVTFRIEDISTGAGTENITGQFRFWDAASGGNILQTTTAAQTWIADYEEICPMCCFTPDTLITMAGGLQVPIGKVQVGDEIRVEQGFETVTEIITQFERTMYLLTFADGRVLRASDDHPLYVHGKGYAAIKPVDGYKDLGKPELLKIGDKIRDEQGHLNEIVSVDLIDYPGVVFTFENSKFYANGMLVY